MHLVQRKAIQRCMARMGKNGQVLAALFSTNPIDGTEEFRFEPPGDNHEVWEAVARVRFRFKLAGQPEFLNESILVSGEPLRLLASTYQGLGYKPFMIAVVRIPDDTFVLHGIRRLMDETAACCIKECDSPKWS